MTNKEDIIKNKINEIFNYIGVTPELSLKQGGNNFYMVDINGNELNFLIGYRGESLDALQNLVNQMIFLQWKLMREGMYICFFHNTMTLSLKAGEKEETEE